MTFEGINNMDDFANMLVAKHSGSLFQKRKEEDSTLMQSPARKNSVTSPAVRTPASQFESKPKSEAADLWCDEHD